MEWWPTTLADLAVVVSGFGTIILIAIIGRQLHSMEKETATRLRPWVMPVAIKPTLITFQNGNTLKFDKALDELRKDSNLKQKIKHYQITLINSGAIPTKISYVLFDQKEKFSRAAFENKLMDKFITIAPNYNYNEGVCVLAEDLEPGKKYYAGISLEYVVNNKKVKSGAIYQLEIGSIDLVENWHD